MAKTKKEMRRMMGNYAEIILRRNKYIKELKERIYGLDQTMQMDRAYIAAMLLDRKDREYTFMLEEIREQSGDEYFIMMHGDPTWSIPDGSHMMDFSVQMYMTQKREHRYLTVSFL